MEAYISVMSFSSSPNSLLDEVATFLFTMMNKWIEHKDNNPNIIMVVHARFTEAPRWTVIIFVESIIRDNPVELYECQRF